MHTSFKNQSSLRRAALFIIIGTTLVWVALNGCTRESYNSGNKVIVARVGNTALTLSDIRNTLSPEVLHDDSLNAIAHYRDSWITNQLMIQEAERNGLENDQDIQAKINRLKNQVLAEAMRDYIIDNADTIHVTKEEAQNYYEAHKDQFTLKERYVRFRHIISNNLDSCQMAKSALMHGIPWPEVVQRYSLDKNKVLNEAKQFYPISLAVHDLPPLNQYLHVIGITEISPIRLIDGRYHFVQLMEQKPKGDHPDISWVLGQIQNWLKLEKEHKLLSSFEQNLYLKAQANDELYISKAFNPQNADSTVKTAAKDSLND